MSKRQTTFEVVPISEALRASMRRAGEKARAAAKIVSTMVTVKNGSAAVRPATSGVRK